MRVLGIDPGSRITGYGIVEDGDSGLKHVENGNIQPAPKMPLPKRLNDIFREISRLIREFEPDEVAIENVFVSKNARSSLLLGHARGTAMVAASTSNLDVAEYTPSQIKKAVVGTGGATKGQIQQMVRVMLGLPEIACEDASDALAVAICHINSRGFSEKLQRSMGRS